MNQKGFVNIILIIGVIILAGAGGYFMVNRQTPSPAPITSPAPIPTPSPTPTPTPTPNPSPTSTTPTINRQLPVSDSQGNNGITVNIVCGDKIYEKPCGIGGVIIKTVDGEEVARRSSDGDNVFKMTLRPVTYLVTPMPGTDQYPIINFEPRQVSVMLGQFTELKLSYWDGRR